MSTTINNKHHDQADYGRPRSDCAQRRTHKWHDEPGSAQVPSFGLVVNGHKLIVRGPDRYQQHQQRWTAKIDGADIAPGWFDSEMEAKQAAVDAADAKP